MSSLTPPAKRACTAHNASTCEAFDLRIRTMYAHNQKPQPMSCVEITPTISHQTKEYGLSLIVLADVSGSMLYDNKLQRMREGIVRLGELSSRFAAVRTDLTVIAFSDSAQVLLSSPTVPSVDELRKVCDDLAPCGGTNIGSALREAMGIAKSKMDKAVHVALFTDGEDGYNLQNTLQKRESFVEVMASHPMLCVHCVGICSGIDCALLDTISRTARRGTFQSVSEDNISMLMGAMWGLMIESVDATSYVRIDIDGAPFIDRKDVVLRICDPPKSCVVPVLHVPQGAKEIAATLVIGTDSFKTVTLTLGETAVCDETDPVCNFEYARHLHAECCTQVALALRCGDYDKAAKLNMDAREVLLQLPSESTTTAVSELEAQAHEIDHARQNREAARELEAREMSRAATERNYGVSIDPTSRSLSDLQTQLLF